MLEKNKIASRFSTPYGQHQDGMAEVSLRLVCTRARAELQSSGLPTEAWFSTMVAVVDSLNSVLTRTKNTTLHFNIFGKNKDVSKRRRFCCEAYV